MKNFLLLLVFVWWLSYYFIPYETKVDLLEKAWIDSSIISFMEEEIEVVKWEIVELRFDENSEISFTNNLKNWEIMSDLSWANQTYVNCFKEDESLNFNWNIVLHRVLLGKNKDVNIKLISEQDNINMFVYKTDALSKIFAPDITYVFDCKSIFNSDAMIIDMNWNTITSDIVIWVAWWNWNLEWEYTLNVFEK